VRLVGVQEVRWEKGGTERAEGCTLFYGQGNGDHRLGTGFLVHKRIIAAVRRVEFIGDRMSYTILRGRRCSMIVLNLHATREGKGDDVKDSFCEELGHVLDQFPRYNVNILLSHFNAKVGRENIFKPTTGNENLHEISNGNGVTAVNFATCKNLVVKSTCSLRATSINTSGRLLKERHNQNDQVLRDRRRRSSTLDVPSFRVG
jgi:hypothetical protein